MVSTAPSNNNFLKKFQFSSLTNWSVQYLLEGDFSYNDKYELVSIGEFLTRNKTQIDIEDDKEYKRVTIKINNGGVYLRDMAKGNQIGTKKQFVISKGQFLLSKIDARNGAFGVVPEEVDNAIITGNFWTFDVDLKKINPHFLALITTTPEFIRFCENASNGTTNRHYLQESLFLQQRIPLPSLGEQDRMVSDYNEKIYLAKKQKAELEEVKSKIFEYLSTILGLIRTDQTKIKKGFSTIKYSRLSKWALSHSLKSQAFDIEKSKWPLITIKELLTSFKGGKTPSKSRKDFWGEGFSWCSPKDFDGLYLTKTEDQITSNAVSEAGMHVFPKGTILSVFRSGILQHSFPTMITQIETAINQDLKAYTLNQELILNEFYLFFVTNFKEYILRNTSKKSVTVESINTEEFLDLNIPVPPIKTQTDIIKQVYEYQSLIETLSQQSKQNKILALQEFEKEIF